jgi:NADPH:quinone reductase-like Zn-dependent oxidoreductase
MLLARSPEERLKMGCSMSATARALVRASVLAQDPQASPAALRRALFLRFDGHEFDAVQRDRILAWLGRDERPAVRSCYLDLRTGDVQIIPVDRFGDDDDGPSPRRSATRGCETSWGSPSTAVARSAGLRTCWLTIRPSASGGSHSGRSACARQRASGLPSATSSRLMRQRRHGNEHACSGAGRDAVVQLGPSMSDHRQECGVKAAFFKEHGGSDKILYDEYRDPVAEAGEVVVRVRACALNHVDMLLLDGRFPPPEGLPHVNGCEVTGTVETLGAGVRGLATGQRVIVFPGFSCGTCEFCLRGERTVCLRYGYLGAHKDGGYAELVKAPAANIVPLPESIAFESGAAVPLAMLTSWHALVAQAALRPGQTVLVQAAGSGVGSAAIQIARLIGARVMTTVGSDDKLEFARGLGAEHVVNYRTQDFVEEAKKWTGKRGVDVVVEHIGGETFERSSYALTRLGTLVSIGSHDTHWGRLDLRHVYSKNLRIVGTNLGSILELRTVLDEVAAGRLKPVIDRAYRLSEARAAVQHVLDRKNKGKVLLVP